ncbi:MAG: helix-turn-helix transcriptional regulator [Deferribacteraceae bacterium]|jgi:AraC-like DNA-binding protein|nr:helix-turn-helix transcriptional regulator [Deferribacteraceae bacterium]
MKIQTQIVVQNHNEELADFVSTKHTVILVGNGTKTIRTDSSTKIISAPNIAVIPRNTKFSITNRSDKDSYKAYCIFLDVDDIKDFYQTHLKDEVDFLDTPMVLEEQKELSEALMRLMEGELPDDIAKLRHNELLSWLIHNKVYLSSTPDGINTKVRRIIESSPNKRWLLNDVAKDLAIGASSLRRELHKEGHTFTELLENCRTSYACGLLQSTDYSLERVAQESGFSNTHRFSLKFKKRFGVTPSKFRE